MARTIVAAACCALLPLATSAETLDELLASRALESVVHPIAAEFMAAEGADRVVRAAARDRRHAAETCARAADEPDDADDARRGRHDERAVDAADARERTAADVGGRVAAFRGRDRPRDAAARRRADAARDGAGDDRAVGARHRRGARIGRARRRRGGRAVLRCLPADAAGRLGADGVPRGHHRPGSAPRRGAADLDARQRGNAGVVLCVAVARRGVQRRR